MVPTGFLHFSGPGPVNGSHGRDINGLWMPAKLLKIGYFIDW